MTAVFGEITPKPGNEASMSRYSRNSGNRPVECFANTRQSFKGQIRHRQVNRKCHVKPPGKKSSCIHHHVRHRGSCGRPSVPAGLKGFVTLPISPYPYHTLLGNARCHLSLHGMPCPNKPWPLFHSWGFVPVLSSIYLFHSFVAHNQQTFFTMEFSTDYKTVITAFLLCLFITYTALLLAEYLLAPKYEPNEPLVVSQRIPFLGHLLGLLIYGTQYFNITR